MSDEFTYFGYQRLSTVEKTRKVADVFDSVSLNYDLMNDLMSLGGHRLWKHFAVNICQLHLGHCVLDLAGGTGDLAIRMASLVGDVGRVVLADVNFSMLRVAYDRLLDKGLFGAVNIVQANAESLSFSDNIFDRVVIGFGLRNVTHPHRALSAMKDCLKPGGKVVILEFSKPTHRLLSCLYDSYSFRWLPILGRIVAKDQASYQYLVESIRLHPDQGALKAMMENAGFSDCDYCNLAGGIVAVHWGYKY